MRSLALCLGVLASCGGSRATSPTPGPDAAVAIDLPAVPTDTPAPPRDVQTAANPDGSGGAFEPVPALVDTPERTFTEAGSVLEPGRDYRAVIETDAGRIVLDLFEDQAPLAVNSFVFLARHRFFDGLAFHRVLEGFVAQGGDPLTLGENRGRWGTGGPGYTFDTETSAGLDFDGPGVLGMARSQSRSSNGSQFFITLAATPNLNGQYTVFGRVTEGLAVLPRIARNATQTTPPANPTRMTRVSIEARAR